jgi:hypothetical protein
MLINSNDVHVIVLCSQYFSCSLFRPRIVCLSSNSCSDFCVGLPSIQGTYLGTLITCCLGYSSFGNVCCVLFLDMNLGQWLNIS